MSMPVITSTPSKIGIPHPPKINKGIREASISSYLDGTEETFVLKLGGPTSSSMISTPHDHIFLGKSETDDREIDVFDAEKYFKEGLNLHQSPKVGTPKKYSNPHHHKKDDPVVEIFAIKEQPTLSIRSESSWNSRTALIQHTVPRNQHQQPPRRANKKNFLTNIGCGCSCADKNSVDIDEYMGETCSFKSTTNTGLVNGKSKQRDRTTDHHVVVRKSKSDYDCVKFDEPDLRVNSDGHFSFPVFNSKPGNLAAKMQAQEEQDAAKRKSLEVFGSPILEKKLTNMTWDAIAPVAAEEIKIASTSREMLHDSDSDASSDLFEIESFSKGNPFVSRQASDALSGCITPTTCYAPSEASIEWSVVTASAADFSVLSDSEELASNATSTMPCNQKTGLNSKIGTFKEIPKLRPGILSGCKNHKAVRVAGDAHKPNEQGFSSSRRHLRSESFAGITRFHDESKLSGFDARSRRPSFDARSLSQSRPGRAAHLLYT